MQLVLLRIGNGTGNCGCSGDGSGDDEAAADDAVGLCALNQVDP